MGIRADQAVRWLFPLPALAFVVVMMLFPIVYTAWLSLHEWSMSAVTPPRLVGLRNYATLLGADPRFWMAVWRTIYFTGLALVVETVLGVAIALLLNRDFPGKNLVKTLVLLPMIATPVAIGMVWLLFYEPTIGLANYVLGLFHLPPQPWLASERGALPSLALVDIWQWTPMVALIVLAGLASLPADPFEAAQVDGATPLQVLWHVTLPLLRPTIGVAVILRAIDALKTFDIIYAMTQGGPNYASETLNLYAYTLGFSYFRMGMASALLEIFFALVLGVVVLLNRARRGVLM
ncbi:carbohydrate ABC transporter permease [Caldinitratiruptor microaerophilus]|nr:sugar ABC transporter permease [Caldinitratiruptor microaerophilus]